MKFIIFLITILSFANLLSKKVLFWCVNSSQIEELYKNPDKPYAVMGEAIVFWSLYEALLELGFEVVNIKTKGELEQNLTEDVHKVVVDIHRIKKAKKLLLNEKFINKIYSVDYWGCDQRTFNERRDTYQNGNFKLQLHQFLTPFDYKNDNQFLGFIIKQQPHNNFIKENYGMYWGKFSHYINKELMHLISSEKINMVANLTHTTFKLAKHITNMGLVDRATYHNTLCRSLFLLGSGDPKAGPSILEALLYNCFVIAPEKQIPAQFINNPGIILIDINNKQEIIRIIKDIIDRKIVFPKNSFPKEFTKEEHLKRVEKLFAIT